MKALLFALCCLLAGCTVPLYETRDGVSIHLVDEPQVEANRYRIEFRFESPTDDPHLIQWVELGDYHGVESFRVLPDGKTGIDIHFTARTIKQNRRITIAPGKVEGADETTAGFAMLPSNWPDEFNEHYREDHSIEGRVVYRRDEMKTVYNLDFESGVLRWSVEGTDIRREWKVPDAR